MATVSEVMASLDAIAPQHLCMEGDPRGLLVGDPQAEVARLVVCLDVTPAVAEHARAVGARMIVSHHPLIYNPLKRILASEPHPGGVVLSCIKSDIAVACAHTNWDIAEGGVNDVLAGLLGLRNVRPVQTTYREPLLNVTVYVPAEDSEAVWNEMANAGAGHLTGLNYDRCGFWSEGMGTFRPLPGAEPYKGQVGTVARVDEYRIESITPAQKVPAVLAAMRKIHPYEEVAYNVFPLSNTGKEFGLGRVGELPEMLLPAQLRDRIQSALDFDAVRLVGPADKPIRTVAVGGGACAFLMPDAMKQGADALITSDIRHHEYMDAESRGFVLVDAGHAQTETPGARELASRLRAALPDISVDFVD
ncbi:MAG: Nif3-like dinuclear metal center hexameric protein [Akkermansiaceae bacterium]|nr:Nif3-like dinuclear metal center hexameric protein [Armatimonadota bacterium]